MADETDDRQSGPLDAALTDEARFRLLVNAVTDYAIYMLDASGNVASWNAGAERFKGYAAGEIIGRHFSAFYTEEDIARGVPATALETSARTGKFEAEGWRVRKDGTRFWAHVVIDPIRSPSGALLGFAKVTRDLTERRQAQEALFQSQKMEAIGQLTGGIAHDFNNLLTAVLGSLELVQRRIGDDPRIAPLVANAVQAAQRGANLTQRMLAFARRQNLNPVAVAIPELVNDMTDLLDRSLGAQHQHRRALSAGDGHGAGRPQPARNGAAQPGRQRARRHAEGRRHHHRGARTGACRDQCLCAARRALRRAVGHRSRRGHGRGDTAAGDGAFLHDQGRGQGHRARPLHGARPGRAIGRPLRAQEQAGRRHDGQPVASRHRGRRPAAPIRRPPRTRRPSPCQSRSPSWRSTTMPWS